MATVKKVFWEDFDLIYPLLEQLNNSHIKKDQWKRLFINHWSNKEDYFGYFLIEKNKAVGFLGLMFSTFTVNHTEYNFCNFTSWVVDKRHRSESIKLLLPVLKMKNFTLTSHTMSSDTYFIFKKLGFSDLEDTLVVIPPLPTLQIFSGECRVTINNKTTPIFLSEKDLKIYNDHSALDVNFIFAQTEQGYSMIIASRPIKKNLPFAHLHYVSNLNIFLECIHEIRLKVCIHLKTAALLVDKRYLNGIKIPKTWEYLLPQPRLYKSDHLTKKDITTLYSEMLLLNL
jgi:hypothetical protein|tara:strand:- start:394 stop:1248 length:855 start_codon:yes stop_codon:yes gene_type:complete